MFAGLLHRFYLAHYCPKVTPTPRSAGLSDLSTSLLQQLLLLMGWMVVIHRMVDVGNCDGSVLVVLYTPSDAAAVPVMVMVKVVSLLLC